jgi:hypothetical protein
MEIIDSILAIDEIQSFELRSQLWVPKLVGIVLAKRME